ncbi:MAG: zf-TFIIB domain-containing protein, partial [Elusimicrobia bacterium]|nr:zf-TFIIB domain-containing protein [Elusimicrobiota bacterium]
MAESFSCPKCRAPLEEVRIADGIVVRACSACSGVMYEWNDVAVPLKLVGAKPARFDCPRCRRPMETATAYEGQIEVDRCLTCSALWFDAGEIQIL